jgi:DNA (cytosine-5)-methyltransferase 1
LRILDLFCGAGGSAVGYHRAFPDAEIVGVDINPQPNYPFTFVQGDALTYPTDGFDFIHASPPCQDHSTLKTSHAGHGTGWMLNATLARLVDSGVPYAVENVMGAHHSHPNLLILCGSMFDLGVRRHRKFWTSFPVMQLFCQHYLQPEPVDVTGTGGPTPNRTREGGGVSRKPRNLEHAREVMGIDWMTRRELSQAIPPAYTEHLGLQLRAQMGVRCD